MFIHLHVIHSILISHYWQNSRVYCLPDNYEVEDASLSDIKRYLKFVHDSYSLISSSPLRSGVFTDEFLESLDTTPMFRKALDGQDYRVGLLGLNDLKKTDYINCVVQVLCRIKVGEYEICNILIQDSR